MLEGHTKLVTGAMELSDRNLLSWSEDGTLRLWDGQSGAPLAILSQGIRITLLARWNFPMSVSLVG